MGISNGFVVIPTFSPPLLHNTIKVIECCWIDDMYCTRRMRVSCWS